jgi:hypothetical protein
MFDLVLQMFSIALTRKSTTTVGTCCESVVALYKGSVADGDYERFVACYKGLVTRYKKFVTHYKRFVTHYKRFVTHYKRFVTHYKGLLPTTKILLPSKERWPQLNQHCAGASQNTPGTHWRPPSWSSNIFEVGR